MHALPERSTDESDGKSLSRSSSSASTVSVSSDSSGKNDAPLRKTIAEGSAASSALTVAAGVSPAEISTGFRPAQAKTNTQSSIAPKNSRQRVVRFIYAS